MVSRRRRLLAQKAAKARMEKLSPERRTAIAKKAMAARLSGLSQGEISELMSKMGKAGAKKKWANISKEEKAALMGKISRARWVRIGKAERSEIMSRRAKKAARKRTPSEKSAIAKKAAETLGPEGRSKRSKKSARTKKLRLLIKEIDKLERLYNAEEEKLRQHNVRGAKPPRELFDRINSLASELNKAKGQLSELAGEFPTQK